MAEVAPKTEPLPKPELGVAAPNGEEAGVG